MEIKRGIVWKNCLILMSFLSAVIIVIAVLTYRSAVSVITEEFSNINQNRLALVENNLSIVIEQCDRLTSTFYVKDDTKLFFSFANPEAADEDYYFSLYSDLLTCRYSFRNFVHSIVLYAPAYNRVFGDSINRPYIIKEGRKQYDYDLNWIEVLPKIEEGEITRMDLFFRAWNESYPYVMTLVKQYNVGATQCVIAIDIDLEKLYENIWPKNEEHNQVSVWVIDKDGNVIIRRDKKKMFESWETFETLSLFTKTTDKISVVHDEGRIPIVYSQHYMEEYELYVVTVSELEDFSKQISSIRMRTIIIGLSCIVLSGICAWGYVSFANKPIKKILSLLENPMDYHAYTEQSEWEVQMIVDRIVSSLQSNELLRRQLDHRLDILKETQIQALKLQINPHFLFNTLNAIEMLIDEEIGDSRSANMTAALSEILIYSLSDEHLVSLKEEIENTRKYIYIMEQRYQGRFEAEIMFAPELMSVKVPKLILQPLIENAVFHGIVAKEECVGGLLEVTGLKELCNFEQEEMWAVRIDIKDNGMGMSEEDVAKIVESLKDEHISMNHIGVSNVAKRLALLFPQKSGLDIKSKIGEGTCITMWFPYMKADN